ASPRAEVLAGGPAVAVLHRSVLGVAPIEDRLPIIFREQVAPQGISVLQCLGKCILRITTILRHHFRLNFAGPRRICGRGAGLWWWRRMCTSWGGVLGWGEVSGNESFCLLGSG